MKASADRMTQATELGPQKHEFNTSIRSIPQRHFFFEIFFLKVVVVGPALIQGIYPGGIGPRSWGQDPGDPGGIPGLTTDVWDFNLRHAEYITAPLRG